MAAKVNKGYFTASWEHSVTPNENPIENSHDDAFRIRRSCANPSAITEIATK